MRTIPVLGTTPALFGQAAAAYVLTQLARQPFRPEPVFWFVSGLPSCLYVMLWAAPASVPPLCWRSPISQHVDAMMELLPC